MKINKLYIIALTFLFIVSACTKIAEGMTGSKRSKSSDEFFVHKKKPLVLPQILTKCQCQNQLKKNKPRKMISKIY